MQDKSRDRDLLDAVDELVARVGGHKHERRPAQAVGQHVGKLFAVLGRGRVGDPADQEEQVRERRAPNRAHEPAQAEEGPFIQAGRNTLPE